MLSQWFPKVALVLAFVGMNVEASIPNIGVLDLRTGFSSGCLGGSSQRAKVGIAKAIEAIAIKFILIFIVMPSSTSNYIGESHYYIDTIVN